MKYFVYLLKGYNNYFNRIIKGYETIAEYLAELGAGNYFLYSKEVNYNPADNVSTKLVMNDCPFEPDYLIYVDDQSNIISRWFVMETVKTRQGQFEHTLRRDVIYDYHEGLLSSPVYVQKGMLQDNDPFILNSEGMSFNEIKTEETLLKDNTKSAWVVAYVAKDTFVGAPNVQVPDETILDYTTLEEIAQENNIDIDVLIALFDGATHKYISGTFTFKAWANFLDNSALELYISSYRDTDFNSVGYQQGPDWHTPTSDCFAKIGGQAVNWEYNLKTNQAAGKLFSDALDNHINDIKELWPSFTGDNFVSAELIAKLQNVNKPIFINGLYKRIKITALTSREAKYSLPITGDLGTIINQFASAWNATQSDPELQLTDISGGTFFLNNVKETDFTAVLETITDSSDIPSVEITFSSTHNVINDQVYDMIAMPYNDIEVEGANITSNGSVAQKIAQALAIKETEKIYDVQLLPYCPFPEAISSNGITIDNLTEHQDYDFILRHNAVLTESKNIDRSEYSVIPQPDGIMATYTWSPALGDMISPGILNFGYQAQRPNLGTVTMTRIEGTDTFEIIVNCEDLTALNKILVSVWVEYKSNRTVNESVVLYPKKSSFSVNIEHQLSLRDSMKIESQCNKYRLVSPNYQGSFDFNVAKNGGSCSGFIAECTYKPYSPYIKVVPQFSYLYGTNFGDARGLICGGDFSLPRLNSAWEQYEFQNKNYQNIFNREIQSLDLEQSIEQRMRAVSGGVGILTGGVAGAAGGAMASGNWIGAVVGGVAGTAGSAIGFGLDMDYLARQQRDQRTLAIDKFNYQLGNIKALPYTITKVGTFDINSKIWPFIEYYTCTEQEKTALENKILFESMTVMRIGYVRDYYGIFGEPRYFKGELIRNTELAEDNHIFEAIYAELLKGVYI